MWIEIYIGLFSLLSCTAEVNDRWYPWYHPAPPYGWMNDVNGLSIFKDEYHMFYQFNPNSSEDPGTAHWGHMKSDDLFNWEHLPIAMYPDQSYDKDGVFSGSAIIENGQMNLFYTAQLKYNDGNDHYNRQALSTSDDGVSFTKYDQNPIIEGDDFQPNFRDPKVWKHKGKYYMVLGNSFDNGNKGRVVLFTSENKTSWNFASVLDQSDGSLGYMWECPDLFELDGSWVLMFSPQGVEPQGDRFRNLYQTGYKIGSFDYDSNNFNPESEFFEADKGTDFYASQTFLDEKHGRRILFAWIDMWEEDYPERNYGFTGQMTLPRVLRLNKDKKLLQWPVKEIEVAKDTILRSGSATSDDSITLENNTAEIKIKADLQDMMLYIDSDNNSVKISYDHSNGTVTVDRGGKNGLRRTAWNPAKKLEWLIYIDRSSIELFCGEGEVTFSCRFFPSGSVTVHLDSDSYAKDMTITSMKRTTPKPN